MRAATRPSTDEHWTIRPAPRRRMAGIASRTSSCQPKKFASKIARRPSVGTSSSAPGSAKAPLLNSAAGPPPVAPATCANASRMLSPSW